RRGVHSAAEAAPLRRTNVRRSITSMLVAWGALSTSLVAQSPRRNAIAFGFTATLGPRWQIEGGDVAYVHRRSSGLLGALSIGARYGLVIGPTAFFANGKSTVRGLFGLRVEAPLARRERRP